jgi:hypothetical protein
LALIITGVGNQEVGETTMRMRSAAVLMTAAAGLPGVSQAACNGQLATRTGPTGITLEVCLDGKYTTCLRDSLRLGWPADSAKRSCDEKRAAGPHQVEIAGSKATENRTFAEIKLALQRAKIT